MRRVRDAKAAHAQVSSDVARLKMVAKRAQESASESESGGSEDEADSEDQSRSGSAYVFAQVRKVVGFFA